ncbi:MAG TPA: transaldolase [Steroidobacteraceae bacterium]|nr:transaldolase [Steroidobacteraceae bacterium]
MPTHNPLQELRKLGQSIWLDDIGRRMLSDGSLARLISEDGIAGVTSNPSILAHSITGDPQYAKAITELLPKVSSSMALYEALAMEDLRGAADLFRPLYDSLQGKDGFVSLEVSPHLAHDTAGSIAEAKRLWSRLDRVNAFIKIPGTVAGIEAIRQLITEGVNVNVTLLFAPERYKRVAEAYCDGLEARIAAKKPIDRLASVASFFLSRIDSNVDPQLDRLAAAGQPAARALRGKAAIANACRAYQLYTELVASPRWEKLASAGARTQRLLWASTSTKDPTYSPIKYVEELIAPDTVNTAPKETIDAYRQRGQPQPRLERHLADAQDVRDGLERLGIDLEQVAEQLEAEGVRKFIEPFDKLQGWLEERRSR